MQTFTDLYRYRFILSNLIDKELKAQYRNMALGLIWTLLNPLVLVSVLSLVWWVYFDGRTNFPSLVLVALIPFNFFSYCLSGCTTSIQGNATLVKKIRFPRQILPISIILTHLLHYGMQALLLVAVLLVFPPDARILGVQLLWLPVILLVQLGLVVGTGLLVSALTVAYRDIQYLVESGLTLLFWGSSIFYSSGPDSPLAELGDGFYYAFHLNPLAGIHEAYRSVLFFGRAPDPGTLGLAAAVTLCIGYLGVRTFWRHERDFADLM